MLGDAERARIWCAEALQLGVVLPPAEAQAAAQLARIEADTGSWAEAIRYVDLALDVVARFGFEERTPMCQVYAIAGYVHAHEGRSDAKDLLKHGLWLVGSLRGVARFVAIDVRILLARSLALVGELELARCRRQRDGRAAAPGIPMPGSSLPCSPTPARVSTRRSCRSV